MHPSPRRAVALDGVVIRCFGLPLYRAVAMPSHEDMQSRSLVCVGGQLSISLLLAMVLAPAGCGEDTQGTSVDAAPADAAADAAPADVAMPVEPSGVEVHFPPARSRTAMDSITVRGTAVDDDGIAAIRVAGVAATSDDGFASWQATVPLHDGVNVLAVEKQDGAGNIITDAARIEVVNAPFLAEPGDMVLDPARNRALVVDAGLGSIMAVDLDTGLPSRLLGGALVEGEVFVELALHPAQSRLWVLERRYGTLPETLRSIDLNTGERTILASETAGSGVDLLAVWAPVVDVANNRILLIDGEHDALVAVDMDTGERTVVLSAGDGPTLRGVGAMVLDAAQGRVLVTDSFQRALLAIDLATGARTVIADESTGMGPWLTYPGEGLDLDLDRNRLLFSARTFEETSLLAVDLTTGERTRLWRVTYTEDDPDGPVMLKALVHDPDHGRVLAARNRAELLAVGLQQGNEVPLLQERVGSGLEPSYVFEMVMDDVRGRALLLDKFGVIELSLWDDPASVGRRSILSGEDFGWGPSLSHARDMILDAPRNRVIINASDYDDVSILAVDMDTGERTLLAGQGADIAAASFLGNKIALDTLHHRLLGSQGFNLVSLDMTTGISAVLSASYLGTGPDISLASEVVVDSKRQRAIMINDGVSLLSIDLQTGDRSILFESGLDPEGRRQYLDEIALDLDHERILVTQPGIVDWYDPSENVHSRAWSVSLTDGTPTELVGPTAGTGPRVRGHFSGIAADSRRDLAVLVAQDPMEVFLVDMLTLQRVIVSH